MRQKISCIYKIISQVHPERIYIGSTYWFQHRKWRHIHSLKIGCHVNKKLMAHTGKYGISDLAFEILENVPDKNKLKEREQYYLDLMNPWFNLQPSASDNRGFIHSEETKAKIGLGNKGKKVSDETKKKMSAAKMGYKWSDEARAKMSKTRKGVKRGSFSEEWKRNLSLAHLGKDSNTKGWVTRRKNKLNKVA